MSALILTPIHTKIIDLLTRCTAAPDRDPYWIPLLEMIQECAGADGVELECLAPKRQLGSVGVAQAIHTVEFPLVVSGRRRGLLRMRFQGSAEYNALPPGFLDTLALLISDEANIHEMRKLVEGAAHDLRGAFVRFNTFAQLFTLDATPAPAQKEVFSHMKRNLESVDTLLRDLYAFVAAPSRATASGSVRTAFEDACWKLKRDLQESGIDVRFEGADQTVRMAEEDLTDVIRRILENSIKFAKNSPGITVSASILDQNVQIHVTDQGPGIETAYLDTVFEPFQRLHGKQYPGHGLGLTICRRKVETAGGMLWAEPGVPSGLSLKILLPQA